jgi:hypothetical protein
VGADHDDANDDSTETDPGPPILFLALLVARH